MLHFDRWTNVRRGVLLEKKPFLTFVYLPKWNIKLPGIFQHSKKNPLCLTFKLILWFGLNSYLNSQSLPHITLSTQRRVLAGGVFPDLTLWLLSHQLTGPICRVASSVRSSSLSLSTPPPSPSSPPRSPPPTSSSSSLQRSQATSPSTSLTLWLP